MNVHHFAAAQRQNMELLKREEIVSAIYVKGDETGEVRPRYLSTLLLDMISQRLLITQYIINTVLYAQRSLCATNYGSHQT
jgi:hypothetical protein